MAKTNLKIIFAGLFSFLFPLGAFAAQPFNLNSLSADGLSGLNLAIPQAGAPQAFGTVPGMEAGSAESLTPAEWDEVFGGEQENLLGL